MSVQKSQKKLFGRYHELALLLMSLIFTSIVGGYLGSYFQKKSWEYQRETQLRDSERTAATALFEEISSLMDTRLYRMRRLIWGYETNREPDEIKRRWDLYREILFKYNENWNRNLALLQRYFGDRIRGNFENQIHGGFFHLNILIERLRETEQITPEALTEAHTLADTMNGHLYWIDVEMIKMVQAGSIGLFNQKD